MEVNRIYNEDCLDTMCKMPNKFVDLVVTSPPYNMRLRVRNGQYTTREKADHFSKKYQEFDDALSIDAFYKFHSAVLYELLRVSKVVCYNFQIVTGSKEAFFKIIGEFNQNIKDIIIWDKGCGQPAMHEKVLNSAYEMVLILEDNDKKGRVIDGAMFDRGSLCNIIRVGPQSKYKSKLNSAVFPERLPVELIKSFSKGGGLIYGPFMGLGTVGVAAKKLKRNFIGSEISSDCCDVANYRIDRTLEPLF